MDYLREFHILSGVSPLEGQRSKIKELQKRALARLQQLSTAFRGVGKAEFSQYGDLADLTISVSDSDVEKARQTFPATMSKVAEATKALLE